MRTTYARLKYADWLNPAELAAREAELEAAVAAASVRTLPADHFERWETDEWVPFTVEADGRIWGHAAGGGCHRSPGECLLYSPDVDPDMGGFHVGSPVQLDNGETVRVGSLTFGGLHADTNMTREQVRQHHENGSTVVGLVRAWDDGRGRLSIAGTLVDGLPPGTIDQIRGTAPSYERWPEAGGLTLLGLHLVPTPAHPVAAAAEGGLQIGVETGCDCDEPCEEHKGEQL